MPYAPPQSTEITALPYSSVQGIYVGSILHGELFMLSKCPYLDKYLQLNVTLNVQMCHDTV